MTAKLKLNEERIIKLYRINSRNELCKIFQCDSCVIKRILKEHGIKIRSFKESQSLRFKEKPESHGWRGKKHSIAQKIKWSKERFGKQRGKKHPNYKNGKWCGRWYRKYKKMNCYLCYTENDLLVHHIDGNHANNNTNNLVTLCPKCHKGIHVGKLKL